MHGSALDGSRADKGELIRHILDAEGLDPRRTVMIGDRLHDAHGAAKNDVKAIGVLWGFGDRSELEEAGVASIAASPAELPGMVRDIIGTTQLDLIAPHPALNSACGSVSYGIQKCMVEVVTTNVFDAWFDGLRDRRAKALIEARISRIELGGLGRSQILFGDRELRVAHGPGYRVYFVKRGDVVVILLCGGDKDSQDRDIKRAMKIAKEI